MDAHVVDLLLEHGIVVVVSARSESKAKDFAERRSRSKVVGGGGYWRPQCHRSIR